MSYYSIVAAVTLNANPVPVPIPVSVHDVINYTLSTVPPIISYVIHSNTATHPLNYVQTLLITSTHCFG